MLVKNDGDSFFIKVACNCLLLFYNNPSSLLVTSLGKRQHQISHLEGT